MATAETDSTPAIQPISLVMLLIVLGSAGIGMWQLYAAANTEPRPEPPLYAFVWLGIAVALLLVERVDHMSALRRIANTLRSHSDPRLLVAAVINVAGVTFVATSPTVPPGFLIAVWCFGLFLYVSTFIRRGDLVTVRRLAREPAIWALCGVVLVALYLRWRNLGTLPWPMGVAEAGMAMEAVRFVRGDAVSPFSISRLQDANLFFYFQSLGIRLFGWNLLGARAVSAVAGALTAAPVFLLAHELFDRVTAWTASVLLIVLPVHVHFSRIGLNEVIGPLVAASALWALLRATRTRRPLWWALAGVLLGAEFYVHVTVPLALVLATLWIVLTIRLVPDEWSAQWTNLFWLFAGGLLSVAPLLRGVPNVADVLVRPGQQLGIIHSGTLLDPERSMLTVFLRRIYRSILGFFALGDSTNLYTPARPLLGTVSRLLALLGLGRLVAIWYDRRALWLGAWLGGTVFVDAVLHTPPTSSGLMSAIPAMVIVIALGIVWLARCLRALISPEDAVLDVMLPALLVAALAILNLSFYFGTYLPDSQYGDNNAEVASEAGRLIAEQPDDPYVYFYGAPRVFFGHQSLQFLGRLPAGEDGPTPADDVNFVREDRPTLLIFLPEQSGAIDAFVSRYPTIDLNAVNGRTGEPLFTWARISQ